MSVRILIDMNLSPDWVDSFGREGWSAVHWSKVGDPRATDRMIMKWAKTHGYIVFTHDLDFGTALALTHDSGPSVLQVRSQNVLPSNLGVLVLATLGQYEKELESGALVVVEKEKNRVRILPIVGAE